MFQVQLTENDIDRLCALLNAAIQIAEEKNELDHALDLRYLCAKLYCSLKGVEGIVKHDKDQPPLLVRP